MLRYEKTQSKQIKCKLHQKLVKVLWSAGTSGHKRYRVHSLKEDNKTGIRAENKVDQISNKRSTDTSRSVWPKTICTSR